MRTLCLTLLINLDTVICISGSWTVNISEVDTYIHKVNLFGGWVGEIRVLWFNLFNPFLSFTRQNILTPCPSSTKKRKEIEYNLVEWLFFSVSEVRVNVRKNVHIKFAFRFWNDLRSIILILQIACLIASQSIVQ